jgi:Zn ribbon nucleic-acid-binding protein
MIDYRGCPRCGGDVLEHFPPESDRLFCINCGWRQAEIPEDVKSQVEAHLGRRHIEDSYKRARPCKEGQ